MDFLVAVCASVRAAGGNCLRKDRDAECDLFKGKKNPPCVVTLDMIGHMEEEEIIYEFSHKAIWASKLTVPIGASTVAKVTNMPPLEHWAFVARGTRTMGTRTKEAYFVVQFEVDHIIPTRVEDCHLDKKDKPSDAMYTTNTEFAALIVGKTSDTDVWIKDPAKDTKKFVQKKGKLVSPDFKEDEWTEMKQPLKLSELNKCVYKTPCSGKEYHSTENNCQHFARYLFDMV